jgi:hypothetical protein
MVSTVLSKRTLKWFVDEGHAEGWNDPRFPTVQGIMRRGMQVNALKTFMLDQGPSKNTNLMEWDKIWAVNKDLVDPVAPRYSAVVKSSAVRLLIENGPEEIEAKSADLHPKNKIGTKVVMYGKELYIESADAVGIEEGEKITLMKWGNVTISKKEIGPDGTISLFGKIDPSDTDYKKTKKITWICADPTTTVEVTLVEYDHLITKPKVEGDESVKDCVNLDSKIVYKAYSEGCVRNLQRGDIIQFERRGFYFVDQAAIGGKEIILNYIPDGKAKAMSDIKGQLDPSQMNRGKNAVKKEANRAEDTKKKIAEAGEVEGDGGEVKVSKKEAKKAAKKADKKVKNAKPEGGDAKIEDGDATATASDATKNVESTE